MSTLLVLGSKPDPALPPGDSYDAVACANASGYSAARHGLPVPAITAMSVILTSGIGSGKQSLKALHGLQTDTLYLVNGAQNERFDCAGGPLPYFDRLIADIRDRTETAMPQAHPFTVMELAILAQEMAERG